MKVEKFLRIFYYVLLIVIVIWIASGFFDVKKYMGSKDEGNVDEFEELENNKTNKKRKKYNFKHVDEIDDLDMNETSVDMIDFHSFKQISKERDFLVLFEKSLIKSYIAKIKIYNNILKKLNSNISKNGSYFELDSNQTRIQKQIDEVKKIINVLEIRIKTINKKKIAKDIDDIINNTSNGLASLIGRDDVKNIIVQKIYTFVKNPAVFYKGFQNIAIYGKSGVGKTKLAETIGYVFAKTGILARRKFRKVSKQEFTSPYVDESASLTRGVVMSCLEGVLFIDEAYGLTPGNNNILGLNTHKDEAITELVNALDLYKGLGITIVGGYEKLMENNFMKSNEGMRRRFPNVIRLDDYSAEQLTNILMDFISDSSPDLEIEDEDADYIYTLVDRLNKRSVLEKQAGDMQNLASDITTSVYGSTLTWGIDIEDNRKIINAAFSRFLKNKNVTLII